MTHRPKIDVDTERLKVQAAGLGATLADAAGVAKLGALDAAAKASGAAGHAKEWTTPKIDALAEWLTPRVEHLYRESIKATAPQVEKAALRATPAIDSAHDKLVADLIPKVVAAVNEAAVKAGAQVEAAATAAATTAGKHSKKAAKAAAKAAKEAAKAEKKGSGAKTFFLVASLLGAGAAAFAWLRSRSTTDPWAEPWEPGDSANAESLRTRAQAATGDAADVVGQAAGSAVARSREATRKAAERVTAATDDLSEKAREAREAAEEAARKVTRRSAAKTPDAPKPTEGLQTAVPASTEGLPAETVTTGDVPDPVVDARSEDERGTSGS
ncbi:hypothetical protein [Cellulomonas shaoxiangyii]|uniref:hypothetical protein n=1 Tax=Cellulomonas shaoxiangyii TaxID=2566013 RepID=UPI001AA05638|nr:hypothetical protein [Cellulomonas shaoxiangyii]